MHITWKRLRLVCRDNQGPCTTKQISTADRTVMGRAGEVTFDRVELAEETAESLLDRFCKTRLLWLRLDESTSHGTDALLGLLRAVARGGEPATREWSVENAARAKGLDDALEVIEKLTRRLQGKTVDMPSQFYCSTVLGSEVAAKVLKEAVSEPGFLGRSLPQGGCIWIFMGLNDTGTAKQNNKRPAETNEADDGENLAGRPEHTDSVACSGTYHHQISGEKIWYLRPCVDASAWKDSPAPLLPSGRRRLRLHCEENDLLLIDTRAWWHETALPRGSQPSVSYAREFFLPDEHGGEENAAAAAERADRFTNVDAMYAERPIAAGDIVVTELDDPTCEAGRSDDPNCVLCDVEVETKRGEVRSVMGIVAVRDIPAGDFITIAPSDSEEDEDDEDDEG